MSFFSYLVSGVNVDGEKHRRCHPMYVPDTATAVESTYNYSGRVVRNIDPDYYGKTTVHCIDDTVRVTTVSDKVREKQQEFWSRLKVKNYITATVLVLTSVGVGIAGAVGAVAVVPAVIVAVSVAAVAIPVIVRGLQAGKEHAEWNDITDQLAAWRKDGAKNISIIYNHSDFRLVTEEERQDIWFNTVGEWTRKFDGFDGVPSVVGMTSAEGLQAEGYASLVRAFFAEGSNPFDYNIFTWVFPRTSWVLPGDSEMVQNPKPSASVAYDRSGLGTIVQYFTVYQGYYNRLVQYFSDVRSDIERQRDDKIYEIEERRLVAIQPAMEERTRSLNELEEFFRRGLREQYGESMTYEQAMKRKRELGSECPQPILTAIESYDFNKGQIISASDERIKPLNDAYELSKSEVRDRADREIQQVMNRETEQLIQMGKDYVLPLIWGFEDCASVRPSAPELRGEWQSPNYFSGIGPS